jgi:thiamine-phosphate pyrophosphorylase
MKEAAIREVTEAGICARELCDRYGAELYIDDHVEVCKHIRATGVHLGKADMPPREARSLLGAGFIIGATANTFADIRQLDAEGVDYIGLGPFRFTETKKNLSPTIGLSGYRRIMQQCKREGIRLPVLAIGGITSNDIPAILGAGISGIALSSAILQATDPVEETKRIIAIINTYKTHNTQ